jgi:DNA replication protein DnaC
MRIKGTCSRIRHFTEGPQQRIQPKKEKNTMPMSMTEIERSLRALRLSGMRATLETRALQVTQGDVTFIDGFSMLLQDELDRRISRMAERRFKLSGLQEHKALSEFDWGFNPRVPKRSCFELVALGFVQRGEHALLIGSPGTGKSHIAKAVVLAATNAGHRVIYREAHKFFEELFEAEQFGRRKKYLQPFAVADLVVIDDLFLRKRLRPGAADDLQEIIMNRYAAKKSILITSNRVVEDWGICLGDQAVASAILDRLLHHGVMLKFQGKSYRLKEAGLRLAKHGADE